jgi:hypothetical protein
MCYGNQEGAAKGYNRHKLGRKSQHTQLTFVADVEMVANFWLRSGSAHNANNFRFFLEKTLSFFEAKENRSAAVGFRLFQRCLFDYLSGLINLSFHWMSINWFKKGLVFSTGFCTFVS